MNSRRIVTLAATSASLGLVLTAAPALADSTAPTAPPGSSSTVRTCSADRLSFVKARVDAAVKKREATIDKLTSALAGRPHVTDAHRSTLTSTYTSDASGLTAVDATVQADTTCAQAVSDGWKVVTDYRVYLLLVPQTHLTAAADTGTWAAGRLTAAVPKVQAAIDALTDPQEKAAAQAKLDDLTSQVAGATSSLSGVADGVLALKPADIPAKLATIQGYRAQVATAHADLAKALADARALRALLGHVAAAPTPTPTASS